MKKKLLVLAAVFLTATGFAQKLSFRNDGTFKICQLTDVHFKNGDPASKASLQLFDELIRNEQPDLVIFTGDIVVEPAPVLEGWKKVIAPFQNANIPFAVALGNHDDEHDKTRKEITDFLKKQRGCLNKSDDFALFIEGRKGKREALLYIFDSNAYSTLPNVKGYGWITHKQVSDYIARSNQYIKQNRGKPLPALAFFHIALPEYKTAYHNLEYQPIGTRDEDECSPEINTGLFAAMLKQGDIMGCFVGHDHMNDYVAYQNGIALTYGRKSSSGTTYGSLLCGSRIIVLQEGIRSYSTYIYELGGKKVQETAYPRKLRFAITSDSHFNSTSEADQHKSIVALNQLELDGVAITGDIVDRQPESFISQIKNLQEKGKGDSTVHTQTFIGLGNHIINPISKREAQNLIEKSRALHFMDSMLNAMEKEQRISNVHWPTRSYSFNLNGVHFIQTNTWAGDTTLAKGGMEWLAKDLKGNAESKRPVILLMEYSFGPNEMRWDNQTERDALANTLNGYNILAIFNSHDQDPSLSTWHGIKVYTAKNVRGSSKLEPPTFYHIEYTSESGLSVKQCIWDSTSKKLTIKEL